MSRTHAIKVYKETNSPFENLIDNSQFYITKEKQIIPIKYCIIFKNPL